MPQIRSMPSVQHPASVLGSALSPPLVLTLGLALSLGLCAQAQAQQQVYRSVDAQGNVTFSSEPPIGADVRRVETVELRPGPSEVDRQAAEARAREIQQAADAYDQRRQAAAEEADKQREEGPPQPRASADESSDAQQWDELLVNGRALTPEQRQKVDAAKRELIGAEARRHESKGGDLYQSPTAYRPDARARGDRE